MLLLFKYIYAEESNNREKEKRKKKRKEKKKKKKFIRTLRGSNPRCLAYKYDTLPLSNSVNST